MFLQQATSQRQPTATTTTPTRSTAQPRAEKPAAYFIAAPKFDKERTGWVFKTDKKGTGYYLDQKVTQVDVLRAV